MSQPESTLPWQRKITEEISMGQSQDDKYTSSEDSESQVRSIINQLNEDTPSHEQSREVVLRPDGTKAIRVVKKRRRLVTTEEKQRRARRSFIFSLLGGLLLVAVLVGAFAWRVAVMSTDAYFRQAEEKLCYALGAESVRFTGARLDGFTLRLDSVVADFPEDCMVAHAELSELSGNLATSSFFTGVMKMDELKIAQARVTLREGVERLEIPCWQGEPLWDITRMECADFCFRTAGGDTAPLAMEHSSAYLYTPATSREARVLILKGGRLLMRGWKPMELLDGKVQISPQSVTNIRVKATTDIVREKGQEYRSYMLICGELLQGAPMDSPLLVDSDNMNFNDFTANRFSHFFVAATRAYATGKKKPVANICLPFTTERPRFYGLFTLSNIRLTSMPAMLAILEHIEPEKRGVYMPPTIKQGRVQLENHDDTMSLSFSGAELSEADFITLRGAISVNAANELSGQLEYGIPAALTHVEYPDGKADPMFREDGVLAWLTTTLSGYGNAPADNSEELDRAAEELRATRPARTPFDRIDVASLSEQMLGTEPAPQTTETPTENPAEEKAAPKKTENPFLPTRRTNPFDENPDNPFGDSTSDGNLTIPVNQSIFP